MDTLTMLWQNWNTLDALCNEHYKELLRDIHWGDFPVPISLLDPETGTTNEWLIDKIENGSLHSGEKEMSFELVSSVFEKLQILNALRDER